MIHLPDYLHITTDIRNELREILADYKAEKRFVLVDEHTKEHCYPQVSPVLGSHTLIEIRSGEQNKTLATCTSIWETLTENAAGRNALLINLGGGVIGDMGGFCAAAYKRGIHFINIPTTLLSQVDASIGGKLGIDFQGFKNHIGFFRLPDKVLIDVSFLETLPERELKSGYAEMIKHVLIRDGANWESFKRNDWQDNISAEQITHSVMLKAGVVEEDPFEKGVRKILNYGHTIGHAIETHFLNSPVPLLHGEAIAAGMIIENFIASEKDLLDTQICKDVNDYISSIYTKVALAPADFQPILEFIVQDKKNAGGKVLASPIGQIGGALWDIPFSQSEIRKGMERYASQI